LVLASVCTACYAFTARSSDAKTNNAYSHVDDQLRTCLRHYFGLFYPWRKENEFEFYIGALIIVITVILNGCYKHYKRAKQKKFLFEKQTFIHKYIIYLNDLKFYICRSK
jgi:hypothetical protein